MRLWSFKNTSLDQEMSSVLLTPSPMNQLNPPETFFFENLTFSKDFFFNYVEMIRRDSIFILLIWKWVLFLVRTFNWCLSTIFLGIVNNVSQWLRMNYATKMIHSNCFAELTYIFWFYSQFSFYFYWIKSFDNNSLEKLCYQMLICNFKPIWMNSLDCYYSLGYKL